MCGKISNISNYGHGIDNIFYENPVKPSNVAKRRRKKIETHRYRLEDKLLLIA